MRSRSSKGSRKAASRTGARSGQLARRVQALEDERAILDVLGRYCHAMDGGTITAWVDCFTTDGALDVRYMRCGGAGDHREEGREALARWIAAYSKGRAGRQQHLLTSPRLVVGVRGAEATAESYFTTVEARQTGLTVVASGRYVDRWVKQRGRWRIAERKAEVWTQA